MGGVITEDGPVANTCDALVKGELPKQKKLLKSDKKSRAQSVAEAAPQKAVLLNPGGRQRFRESKRQTSDRVEGATEAANVSACGGEANLISLG